MPTSLKILFFALLFPFSCVHHALSASSEGRAETYESFKARITREFDESFQSAITNKKLSQLLPTQKKILQETWGHPIKYPLDFVRTPLPLTVNQVSRALSPPRKAFFENHAYFTRLQETYEMFDSIIEKHQDMMQKELSREDIFSFFMPFNTARNSFVQLYESTKAMLWKMLDEVNVNFENAAWVRDQPNGLRVLKPVAFEEVFCHEKNPQPSASGPDISREDTSKASGDDVSKKDVLEAFGELYGSLWKAKKANEPK